MAVEVGVGVGVGVGHAPAVRLAAMPAVRLHARVPAAEVVYIYFFHKN